MRAALQLEVARLEEIVSGLEARLAEAEACGASRASALEAAEVALTSLTAEAGSLRAELNLEREGHEQAKKMLMDSAAEQVRLIARRLSESV